MNELGGDRRFFLSAIAALGLVGRPADPDARNEFVLGSGGGIHLVHYRDQGNVFIKFGSHNGSDNLAIGTQQVMRGTGIPIHRHTRMEEAFYVLEGRGTVTLDDVPRRFEPGSTIRIPIQVWHGFQNPDHELLLLWVVTPAGLDGFFRETCSPPGEPPRRLTREQIQAIARKYATEFR